LKRSRASQKEYSANYSILNDEGESLNSDALQRAQMIGLGYFNTVEMIDEESEDRKENN
jgi:hypothetical protein